MKIISHPGKDDKRARASDFAQECALFFVEVVQVFGVPKSVGQIYGVLYASPVPLSFSDIVERLEISKGSASQGLQLLRALGAVQRMEDSGDGREYFGPELGLRRLLNGILRGKIEPIIGVARMRMGRLRILAESTVDVAHKEFQLERVEQLATWQRRLKTTLPILSTLFRSNSRS